MPLNQVLVAPTQLATSGQTPTQTGDVYGNTLMQSYNGQYAEIVRRGNVFMYSTPTAAALLLSATTGNCPTIWNPAGSGMIFYPLRLAVTWLTGATTVGSLIWSITKGTGEKIGTAMPILTFTDATPEPALVGGSKKSKMRFAPATCTFTAAPAFLAYTGVNIEATNQVHSVNEDYYGSFALMPGNALSLTYSVTTSTSTHYVTIWGAEVPLCVAGA
jgi:hypothetical protein